MGALRCHDWTLFILNVLNSFIYLIIKKSLKSGFLWSCHLRFNPVWPRFHSPSPIPLNRSPSSVGQDSITVDLPSEAHTVSCHPGSHLLCKRGTRSLCSVLMIDETEDDWLWIEDDNQAQDTCLNPNGEHSPPGFLYLAWIQLFLMRLNCSMLLQLNFTIIFFPRTVSCCLLSGRKLYTLPKGLRTNYHLSPSCIEPTTFSSPAPTLCSVGTDGEIWGGWEGGKNVYLLSLKKIQTNKQQNPQSHCGSKTISVFVTFLLTHDQGNSKKEAFNCELAYSLRRWVHDRQGRERSSR